MAYMQAVGAPNLTSSRSDTLTFGYTQLGAFVEGNVPVLKVRCFRGGAWSAWSRTDNFGCNTASDLASLLGVRFLGMVQANDNLNTICTANDCFYAIIADTNIPTNAPTNVAGAIFGINFGSVVKVQFYILNKWSGGIVYVRNRWFGQEETAWGDWKQLAITT